MRAERIFSWIITVLIAIGIWWLGGMVIDYLNAPEKQLLTADIPLNMEDAFREALKSSPLRETHKIVITNESDANICVDYAKHDDESYQKFAFSPFVVAYSDNEDYLDKLVKSNVCVESQYAEDYYEIDFLKVINEAIGTGEWANLGIEDQNKIKVFYPDKKSIYWEEFHDFLLVTLNDGKYPETEKAFNKAEEIIDKFIDSKYTQGVTEFVDQVRRTGGFSEKAIYVLTESDVIYATSELSENARIFYPLNTVYFNYYVKGDELGQQIINSFDKDVYAYFHNRGYRSLSHPEVTDASYVVDERDVYNVVEIPKKKEFATSQQSE